MNVSINFTDDLTNFCENSLACIEGLPEWSYRMHKISSSAKTLKMMGVDQNQRGLEAVGPFTR
jgi:hypothetical protein